MQLSNSQYNEMAKDASAPSKSWFNIPKAFVIGGLICLIGQGILELYKATGFEKDEAAALELTGEGGGLRKIELAAQSMKIDSARLHRFVFFRHEITKTVRKEEAFPIKKRKFARN